MNRVKKEVLIDHSGITYYKDGPFSGVAYTLDEDKITQIERYLDGKATITYINKDIDDFSKMEKIDYAYLEPQIERSVEEPYCYQETLFTGIAFEFKDDVCIGECYYKDGRSHTITRWLTNGQPFMFQKEHDTVFEMVYWHYDGTIKSIEIAKKNSFHIVLKFNEYGEIECYQNGKGDYFEHAAEIKKIVKHVFLEEKNAFIDFSADSTLNLTGPYVDNEIFGYLKENSGLEQVRELTLFYADVDGDALLDIAKLPNIQRIFITNDRPEVKQYAQRLKNLRNDINIEVNREYLSPSSD